MRHVRSTWAPSDDLERRPLHARRTEPARPLTKMAPSAGRLADAERDQNAPAERSRTARCEPNQGAQRVGRHQREGSVCRHHLSDVRVGCSGTETGRRWTATRGRGTPADAGPWVAVRQARRWTTGDATSSRYSTAWIAVGRRGELSQILESEPSRPPEAAPATCSRRAAGVGLPVCSARRSPPRTGLPTRRDAREGRLPERTPLNVTQIRERERTTAPASTIMRIGCEGSSRGAVACASSSPYSA